MTADTSTRPRRTRRQANAMPRATETQECIAFYEWASLARLDGEPLALRLVHIANERSASARVHTAILTKMGMRSGFPDYQLLMPVGPYHGLMIEAKRAEGGRVKGDQEVWQSHLRGWGYAAEICAGALQMIAAARAYLRPLSVQAATQTGPGHPICYTQRFVDRVELDGVPPWILGTKFDGVRS